MIRSYCCHKMAPKVVEMCDFNASMVSSQLGAFPYSMVLDESPGWRPDRLCDGSSFLGSFGSIEEEEREEDQQDALAKQAKQDIAEGSIASTSTQINSSVGVGMGVITGASTCAAMKNRQIMKCMCSSALMLFSITALLLLLPLVLPPLPPPPSELMLLPVAILLLLVCAALSPRSPPVPSAASAPSPQSIPLLPLAHSLPLRSSMPL